MGKQWKQWQTLFTWAPKSLWTVTAAMKFKDACSLVGKLWQIQTDLRVKKQRHHFADKIQSYGFPSSHLWMWKERWARKNRCFWTVVLETTLESLLDCREIQAVYPKENQSEYLLEGLMLKLKLQYFGHLMQRTDSLGKTLMLGKIAGRRRRGWQRMRWLDGRHHSLNRHEFEQTPRDSEGQGSLVRCSL